MIGDYDIEKPFLIAKFHPVVVQRYAKKYVDQLSKYQSEEVEIIPYEELWERVLELLG